MVKRFLFLLVGSFMVIGTASADCVKCDTFGECTADVSATACSCNIRVLHGKTICREVGICDGGAGCDGGGIGPVLLVKPFYLEESAISRLSKKDFLLSMVIAGSIGPDAKGKMRQLMTDDYNGGTVITGNETFHQRGSFVLRTGDLTFRFSLENLSGQEKIEYVGTISDNGRHIQFSKIRTDEVGNVRRTEDGLDLVPAKN